jgi:hypothetical protein
MQLLIARNTQNNLSGTGVKPNTRERKPKLSNLLSFRAEKLKFLGVRAHHCGFSRLRLNLFGDFQASRTHSNQRFARVGDESHSFLFLQR